MSSFILLKVTNLFFSQTSPDNKRLNKQAIFRDKTTFFWNVPASRYVNNMYDLFPDEFLSCSKEDYCAKLVL